MRVLPDHKGETSGRLKSNRQLPYTMHQFPDYSCQMSGRSFWTAILALRRYASGRYTTSSGRLIDLPFLVTWKESVNRSRTDRRPDVLLKRPDGASWHRSFSIQWSVRTDDAGLSGVRTVWHIVRAYGVVDRWASGRDDTSSGWLTGNFEILLTSLWIVESLFAASLHISDFVQTQNDAKILTNSPFGHSVTKITWPVWKYIPGPK
jgi:hypothetical protein